MNSTSKKESLPKEAFIDKLENRMLELKNSDNPSSVSNAVICNVNSKKNIL